MERRRNLSVWVGFLVVLAAFFTYPVFFVRFPVTRDVPWANLLIFAAGLALIGTGVRRAFREPALYRGRISGAILGVLAVGILGLFCFGTMYYPRLLPASLGAPKVGQKAPDFTLPDKDGNPVTLSKLLEPGAAPGDRPNGVLLVFYRGYW